MFLLLSQAHKAWPPSDGNGLSLSYTNLVGKFRCFSAVLGLTGEVSRGKLLSDKKVLKKWLIFGGETMTLDQLPLGKEAVITAVGGEGPLRCRLLDMGLIPKTRVRVEKVAPLGDPIELRVRDYALSLRKEDARSITVEVKHK
jgi:Fe2+ transport system protein FeoA